MRRSKRHLGDKGRYDGVQSTIASYAMDFDPDSLDRQTIHAAKKRVIDTLGCLYAGIDSDIAVKARRMSERNYSCDGATILGTLHKAPIDIAAFVNGTATRVAELNDTFHCPGRPGGHPSDIVAPLLSVAEVRESSGTQFLGAVVLGYEIFIQMAAAIDLRSWDSTNWVALATAVGAGKLLELPEEAMMQAISMAVIPNVALRRTRLGTLTGWKACAAGQAARAGTFAALLAEAGLQGPTQPFEGEAGWLDERHLAQGPIDLTEMGSGLPFQIHRSILKRRNTCATGIPAALAAEKAYIGNSDVTEIDRVLVETYSEAKSKLAEGPHHWDPQTRESADHSLPYIVAVGIVDGEIGPHQFSDKRRIDKTIQKVLRSVEVVENQDFTYDYDSPPHLHRTRVTVFMSHGEKVVGETGGEHGDAGDEMSDAETNTKFMRQAEDHLARVHADKVLDALWQLDSMPSISPVPALLSSDSIH